MHHRSVLNDRKIETTSIPRHQTRRPCLAKEAKKALEVRHLVGAVPGGRSELEGAGLRIEPGDRNHHYPMKGRSVKVRSFARLLKTTFQHSEHDLAVRPFEAVETAAELRIRNGFDVERGDWAIHPCIIALTGARRADSSASSRNKLLPEFSRMYKTS